MKQALVWIAALALVVSCAGPGGEEYAAAGGAEEAAAPAAKVEFEAPEALALPEYKEPASEEDWASRLNNKDREIIEVLNVVNPVAAYITAGFEQHGEKFSDTLNEEWADTQVQLTAALTLYEDCKKRRGAGTLDKQLFLDMEEVWQLLVKTGVAGVRTKSMIESEL